MVKQKLQYIWTLAALVVMCFVGVAWAQETTAVRKDQGSINLEVQAEQAKKLLNVLDKHIDDVASCADANNLWNGTTCVDPEVDPNIQDHAKAPMISCSASNAIPFWNGTQWICKTLTNIPIDCQVNVDVLGQCNVAGRVFDGTSQNLSCSGTFGNCSATVSCADGNITVTGQYCTPPADCPVVVGGDGCTSSHTVAHDTTDSWFCDGTYVGTCEASCYNGVVSNPQNNCTTPPPANCYDRVAGAGCSTYKSINHGSSSTWSCDSGYTGNCKASCDNGSFVSTSNSCTPAATTGPWSYGYWSAWSACSASCGGGTQSRTRVVTCDYSTCTGTKPASYQSQSCNTQACPPTATSGPWTTGSWSSWSTCSTTCGGGTQTRTRSVTCSYDSCTGTKPATSESQSCNTQACATSGPWTTGSWSSWSTCSATCGGGTQTRTRSVTCSYDSCTGTKPATSESQSCNTQACATSGPWTTGSWSSWSLCSKTCGGGTQTRTRSVTCSYDSCTGTKPATSESQTCNTDACITTGPWTVGSWSAWSTCSKTCGGGTQTRTRSVTCKYSTCTGTKPDAIESRTCNTGSCAVNCVGSWVNTGQCVYSHKITTGCGCCYSSCTYYKYQEVYNITTPASGGGTACPYADGATRLGDICKTTYSGCFSAETFITMADGTLKPIIEIEKGEKVKAPNGSVNTVLSTSVRPHNGNLYAINESKEFVTGAHPIRTTEGWKAFDPLEARMVNPELDITQLKVGDVLLTDNGEVELEHVSSRKVENFKVYNLHLDGNQEYYADGFLVHNK